MACSISIGCTRSFRPYYSHTGRPSIDPVLMIRMLIVGYVFAIRSEPRLCSEVRVNLAIDGFFRRAWVVNSVVFGWPGGKRSEGFRLLCVLNARRRRRTGWVEKGSDGLALPRDQPANAEPSQPAMRAHPTLAPFRALLSRLVGGTRGFCLCAPF